MSIRLTGTNRPVTGRPELVGPHNPRKVGILGANMASLHLAPYDDPSWELWIHASIVHKVPKGVATCYFDLHPPHCFTDKRKNGFKDYYQWLQRQTTPIWMQETYPEIPGSMRFPKERIRQEWPNVPVGSQTAWMIGCLLLQGVTHIGLWGCHYSHDTEYRDQRANTERWVGIAEGRGVQIVCPKENPLCHEPRELYAYETHSTVEKYEALKVKFASAIERTAFCEDRLVPCETPEQLAAAEAIRRTRDTDWAREADQMSAADKIPQALLDWEQRQRDNEAGRTLAEKLLVPA